jgi:hypothetical protein
MERSRKLKNNLLKKEKKKEVLKKLIYFISLLIVLFFLVKILAIVITTTILVNYGAAYDWYQMTGNEDFFIKAKIFTQNWILDWIFLALSTTLFILVRRKKND